MDGKMEFHSQLWSAYSLLLVLATLATFTNLRRGISVPKPGQRVVKPGAIIMGYPGDPLYGAKPVRPEFTKDGAFLVFRKLEQNVLFLEDYTNKNWPSIPAEPEKGVSLDEKQRKELFAARLVGRFKSVR